MINPSMRVPSVQYLVGEAEIAMALFLALAPGVISPLGPFTADWMRSLTHRNPLIAAHVLGFAFLVVLMA